MLGVRTCMAVYVVFILFVVTHPCEGLSCIIYFCWSGQHVSLVCMLFGCGARIMEFSLRTSHVRSAGSPFLVSLGLGEWGRDNMVSEQEFSRDL